MAELRRRKRDAIVPGHRQFHPAAKGGSMNGNDHRLRTVLDFQEQRKQSRAARLARCHLAELFNVRARHKSAAAPNQDRRFDTGVLSNLVQGFGNAFGDAGAHVSDAFARR